MLILTIGGGFVLLIAGGDTFVRGAVSIARGIGVSPLLIGLTLVGFGTSTPELITSVEAALIGSPGISIGNVVGSNICNILLILGVAALVRPIATSRAAFLRDGTVVVLAAVACLAVVLVGDLGRMAGAIVLAALVAYVVGTYRHESRGADAAAARHAAEATVAEPGPRRLAVAILMTGFGLAMIMLGATWLVEGAVALARSAGVSETVVGLTIVAIGTSLPELVTSLVAAVRGQSDVAFGNVVGSNIYNVLGILGATALFQPIPVPPEIARFDIWVMLAATGLLVSFATSGWRLSRTEGGLLLAGYVAWLTLA